MKRQIRGLVVNDMFFTRPEVVSVIAREGAAGLGKLVALCVQLLNCDNAIGTESDLDFVTGRIKSRGFKMREMIRKSRLFCFKENDKGLIFSLRFLRVMLGLEDEISEDESKYIECKGNKTKKMRLTCLGKKAVSKKSDALQTDCKSSADGLQKGCKSSANDLRRSKKSDSKMVSASPICNMNNDNDYVHDITVCNGNVYEHASSTVSDVDSAAGGEEDSFNFLEKKLSSCTEWRKSTSRTRGINLEDDKVLHFFAEWMRDYCISNNSMPRGQNKILHYASSLLTQGLRTRKCFDEAYRRDFLHEAPSGGRKKEYAERPVYAPKITEHRGTFEQLIGGRRIGLDGQVLPPHAPKQRNENERWSYRLDRYVDVSEWNRDAEEKARLEWEEKQEEIKREKCSAMRVKCDRIDMFGTFGDDDNVRTISDIINNSILPGMKHQLPEK